MDQAGLRRYRRHHLLANTEDTEMTTDVKETLVQRGKRYGNFDEHARVTYNIKKAMQNSGNWETLAADQKEALDMIAHKIGRILCGDPNYDDSWHDIAGYSVLVEQRLIAAKNKGAPPPPAPSRGSLPLTGGCDRD